jgi:hypothetical protein
MRSAFETRGRDLEDMGSAGSRLREVATHSSTNEIKASCRIVAYASSRGLDNSPGFDAKPVIHRDSQTLLAADVALRRLY